MASLWVGNECLAITNLLLESGLIAANEPAFQAVGKILLGNLIVLIPPDCFMNDHAGTRYGIPFPSFVRAPSGSWRNVQQGFALGGMRLVRIPVVDSAG